MRQLAAQIAMLLFTKRATHGLRDINAASIDNFYYENLGFDAHSEDAHRLQEILDRLGRRPTNTGCGTVKRHESTPIARRQFSDGMNSSRRRCTKS
jgi:hypothetical protein